MTALAAPAGTDILTDIAVRRDRLGRERRLVFGARKSRGLSLMLYGTGRLIVADVDLCSVKFSLSVETIGSEGRASGLLFAPQYCLNEAVRAGIAQVLTANGRSMFLATVTRVKLARRAAFAAPWPPMQVEAPLTLVGGARASLSRRRKGGAATPTRQGIAQ